MKRILAAVVLFLTASTLCASTLEGTWTATTREDGLDLGVSYGRTNHSSVSSQRGRRLQFTDLRGLTAATTMSATQVPVSFTLEREAGFVAFSGVFRNGKGSGHFEFSPAGDYTSRLAAAGVRTNRTTLDPERQLLMLLLDVSTDLLREMRSLGYDDISLDDAVSLGIFRVTPQMVREFAQAGYRDLSIPTLTKLRIHKVTVDYLRQLDELGLGPVSLDKAVEMRIHKVTPEYVRQLRSLGYPNLTQGQLVEMRIFKITPEFIRKLAAAGYTDLTVKRLVQIKIHGVEDILLRRQQ
jgi:hypothetical protein